MKKRWIAALSALILLCMTGCMSPTDDMPDQGASGPVVLGTAASQGTTGGTVSTAPSGSTDEQPVPERPDPETLDNDTLVKVADWIPGISQDLAYAAENNFTGRQIYSFTEVWLRGGTVKKLALVCEELAQYGMGIRIWDGFRPLSAQAMLWEICPDATYVSNPVTGNCSHCRGSAVDVTLVDLNTGEELEMPSGFDEFSARGDRDYSDCTPEAAQNAQLLQDTMEKYGFKSYYAEWWHYSDTDTYSVESCFDPAMDTLWYAACDEFMNLREEASTGANSLAIIYPGETMELLGWQGYFAKVRFGETVGYVLTTYIKPVNEDFFTENLNTVDFEEVYTYERMLADVYTLAAEHPDAATVEIIGFSEMGRQIPVLRIGNEDATHHILCHASIHGTEHATAWLVMAMADYWLDHGILGYGDVCYHIIPMVNPDGVVTVQTGELSELQMQIYERDTALGYTTLSLEDYAHQWKANGMGVDLNRNFSAGWETISDKTEPSFMLFAGDAPFSASEVEALRDYTLRYDFGATISYHAMGSLIYYEYGDRTPVNAASEALAQSISGFSGYPLVGSSGLDAAGYKDWAIDELCIPSLTIEIGSTKPVQPGREMCSIFARNYNILPTVALWLQNE